MEEQLSSVALRAGMQLLVRRSSGLILAGSSVWNSGNSGGSSGLPCDLSGDGEWSQQNRGKSLPGDNELQAAVERILTVNLLILGYCLLGSRYAFYEYQ